MSKTSGGSASGLAAMRQVIERLLGPGGCPWDQKQTPESLADYVIEEGFELVEAIRAGDSDEVLEELGDVAFLLAFIAELYARRGEFDLDAALSANAAKMIRRHPHVFSDTEFSSQDELLRNWERIKRAEKSAEGEAPKRVFASLPKGLPPLLKSYRINSKAARVGFTWASDADQAEQLAKEWAELQEAEAAADHERVAEEFGDYLFCLSEWGRRRGIKANEALDGANRKFLARFEAMEELARGQGSDLSEMTLAEMDALWDQVKKTET